MTPADTGKARIDWAVRTMPVLDHALATLPDLRDVPVTLAFPLDPKAAALALHLSRAGAVVSVSPTAFSVPDLEAALVSAGVRLDVPPVGYVLGAAAALAAEPPEGVRGLTTQEDCGEAKTVPVVDLSGLDILALVEGQVGIGQASVMAFLDITNLQLAGRRVCVAGFGRAGQSVAAHVAALGGRVVVVEGDAVRALAAVLAGHGAQSFAGAVPSAEVIFVTDDAPRLIPSHLALLAQGAMLCAVGSRDPLLSDALAHLALGRALRAHVTEHGLPSGRAVKLIASGQPIHLTAGQGLPVEVADVALALHVAGRAHLLQNPQIGAGIQRLDARIVTELAQVKLAALGQSIEPSA